MWIARVVRSLCLVVVARTARVVRSLRPAVVSRTERVVRSHYPAVVSRTERVGSSLRSALAARSLRAGVHPFTLSVVLASASLLGGGIGAAAAQAPGAPQPADTSRPFVPGGVYDKPYLTTLLGRTALGGYAEAHARLERVDGVTDELGFVAKRFNLFTATRVSDFVRIGAELEVEEGGEEITLEYAAIDVIFHPALTLRGGMILAPLGRFNLAHDSPLNDFTDRPLVSTELLGVALSEPGLGLLGLVPLGTSGARVTYEAYGVNGFHEGVLSAASEGTRIPAGTPSLEDDNASPSLVARVALSPRTGWELGVSAHHGAYNRFEVDGLELDERRNLTILVGDFEGEPLGVRVKGELALATLDLPPALSPVFAERQRGFYVEAVRPFGAGWIPTMPSSSFVVGARLDAVDFDAGLSGDSVEQLTLVLGFRPTSDTALKLDYARGRAFDRFNNRADHAHVLLSLATYF
jgi:hypothetical protein